MLAAVAGSQGSGKTSTLSKLEAKGFPIVSRKTSRSILSEWNMTLSEVHKDRELTMKFQDEISRRKVADEMEAINSKELWFTERTHSDLFIYASVALGKDDECSQWLDEYYKTCLKYSQSYELVFYLRSGLFQVQADGVRGANQHYSRLIDTTLLDFTQQMIHPSRLSIIDTPDLSIRAMLIAAQARSKLPQHIG